MSLKQVTPISLDMGLLEIIFVTHKFNLLLGYSEFGFSFSPPNNNSHYQRLL